jgi:tetratricopeptide (TPR) repeat protein
LGLNTEHLLPLEGLPCPGPEDLDRFAAFDAARLFVSAAQRVEPTLAAAAEAAAIVDICRQVDGMPLALELAAAWTRVLSCQTIALELRSGIALLQAHGGANPPRHASIEHVFEQSWRHLGTAERQTLARLSIFHGGFTADAARAVATCALPVLASLADKSLLRKEGQQLSLHPLVQQFAAARLTAVERATTQAAHALYFHRLLAQLGAGVDLGERLALRAVDDELQNYLAALDWAIRQGQAEATQRCADVLCKYLEHRGGFETGLQLLNGAIEACQLQEHGALQAWLRCRSAQFLYRLERYAEAEAVAQEALRGASRSADASIRLRALNVVALCALRQGRLASARLLFRQVHALASTQPDGRLTASTLDHLALVEKRLGHYAEALRLSLEALAQHRAEGDEARLALCLNNLATLYLSREKRDAAASHLREALAICERNGLAATMAYVLANLIEVAMASGAQAQAETYAARALDIAESCGSRATHIWVQAQQGRLAVRRGDMAAAATTLAVALSRAHESAPSQGCKPALLGFAELLHASGDPECAQRVLGIAAAHTSMGAHERDELLAQMARWADGAETGAAAPPTVDYAELVHRIVSEAPDGHTGLRGLLRSGATTTPSPC